MVGNDERINSLQRGPVKVILHELMTFGSQTGFRAAVVTFVSNQLIA